MVLPAVPQKAAPKSAKGGAKGGADVVDEGRAFAEKRNDKVNTYAEEAVAKECEVARMRVGQLLGRYLAYVSELQGSYDTCKESMERWVKERYRNDCGAVAALSVILKVRGA